MSSFFSCLFSCCSRSHNAHGSIGEADHLLPGDGLPDYVSRDIHIEDRQRVKERLNSIVRSKEGKMVNITDHLPFNFQNKDQAIASTSRLRAGSPSPHPSVATADSGTTSCSGSSLRPQGGRPVILKEAALSVRLVRGRDGGYRGTINRGRLGGFGEERGIEWSANGIADDLVRQFTPENTLSSEVVVQEEVPPDIVPLDDVDRNAILVFSEQIGNQLKDGWKIQDVGPISRGWGD